MELGFIENYSSLLCSGKKMALKLGSLHLWDLGEISYFQIADFCFKGLINADEFFQIAPTDVNIYYDTPKQFERYCVPPSQSEFVITWWKGDKRLGSQDKPNANTNIPSRIKITETSDLQTTKWHSVTPGSKISLLQIDSVLPTDQGEYSCVATNKSGHFSAKFEVKVTGKKNEEFIFVFIHFIFFLKLKIKVKRLVINDHNLWLKFIF